ncbi:MAG: UDP-N-acetylmuramyl-tripeptide synthetase [Patescibacteria group bacterium]|nr:UDP-N-acetylmuramyl-tripeptide synthetase [Patescibacteria group bacterium]
MKESFARLLRSILPTAWAKILFDSYHRSLAFFGAIRYRHPSRELRVIAVTGTKGKSTVVEIVRAMLREGGFSVASASTIRFCIKEKCEPNLYKMTMVGRFFLQHFLRQAVEAGCDYAVIEMTSEGAVQFRHKGIDLDGLIFTNLAPEHLESHGGMEAYAAAKLSLAAHLEASPKHMRIIVANAEDAYGAKFLATKVEMRVPFSLKDAQPYTVDDKGARFTWRGELFTSPLPGLFNLKNTLAALALCEALGIPRHALKRAVEKTAHIAGRAERLERGQPFSVVVDYAHTPDSLRAIYETFTAGEGRRICVLGSTGGGRDTWKRPAMGNIADKYCDIAFLTDEDPYDEDPRSIAEAVAKGFARLTPQIVMDRREAIASALREARAGDAVLITGKGTDPYIMRAKGEKESWSDRRVVEEELDKLLSSKK